MLQELFKNVTPYVMIIIPQMKNGSQNHAFCVVDSLIFDSTQVKAMKLQKTSVEWICKPNNGFRYIHSAYCFNQKWKTKESWGQKTKLVERL